MIFTLHVLTSIFLFPLAKIQCLFDDVLSFPFKCFHLLNTFKSGCTVNRYWTFLSDQEPRKGNKLVPEVINASVTQLTPISFGHLKHCSAKSSQSGQAPILSIVSYSGRMCNIEVRAGKRKHEHLRRCLWFMQAGWTFPGCASRPSIDHVWSSKHHKSDRHEQPSQQTVKKQMVPVLFLRSFAGCIMKQSNSLLQTDCNSLFRNKPSGCPLNPTAIHSNSSTNLLMLHKENEDFEIFHFHLYYPMTSITPVLLSAIRDCFG